MIIDELIAVLGYDVRGEAELARFNAGLERAAMLASRMATMLVAAGTLAAGALAGLGKSVIETSSKFEGYETSLQTIEGSAEKAKAAMDWVSKFAAKTPYELDGVTEAFIKLRAYGFDPMDGTLKTLGDTASAMNKPLNQAVEAFADAATGEFERLKEFGIKAEQKGKEVTFRWQQDGKEMTKTVKKNGKEIQKFLLEVWGKRFGNAMDRQSRTWKGMMSNLSDSWDDFKRRIGSAGFFDAAKKRLKGILDEIAKLDKDGTLDRWAKSLSGALTSGMNLAFKVVERLVKNLITLAELLGTVGDKIGDFLRDISGGKIDLSNWEALALTFAALLAVLKPAWAAAVGISLAIDDFLTYMRGGDSVIGDMIAKIKELGISFDSIGSTISSAASSMGQWITSINWTDVGKNLGKTLVDGIKSALSTVSAAIVSVDWGALGQSIGSSIDFGAIGKAWYAALKAQFDLMGGLKEGLVQALSNIDWASVGSTWVSLLKAQMDLIKGVFDGLTQNIGETIKGWFDGVDWSGIGEQIKKGVLAALVAIPAALIALFTGADYTQIGTAIGNGILAGLQSMGGAIKDWFAGLLPGWASEFFDWKTEKDGSMKAKAKEEGDRRRQFEEMTKPRGGNTPGLGDTMDNLRRYNSNVVPIERARKAQRTTDEQPGKSKDDLGYGQKIMSAISNLQGNMAKVGIDKGAQQVINDNSNRSINVNPNVSLTVQQIQQAGVKAGEATKAAVDNVAKTVPNQPRVANKASF